MENKPYRAKPIDKHPNLYARKDVERERVEIERLYLEAADEWLEWLKSNGEWQERAEAALATSQLASSKLAASEKEVKRLEEELFQERDSVEDLTENLKEAEARVRALEDELSSAREVAKKLPELEAQLDFADKTILRLMTSDIER